VSLCDLALFSAGGCFGRCGNLGPPRGFESFGSGCLGGFFGLAQGTAPGGVGIIRLGVERGLCRVTSYDLCRCGGVFRFGLSDQSLFFYLLRSALSQLRAVFATRCGEVAILRSVKICPGIKYCHIFRCFRYWEIIDLVDDLIGAVRVHSSWSCMYGEAASFSLSCAGSLPAQRR
jgi:hypothetical protein